jgi:hypothetical protein
MLSLPTWKLADAEEKMQSMRGGIGVTFIPVVCGKQVSASHVVIDREICIPFESA